MSWVTLAAIAGCTVSTIAIFAALWKLISFLGVVARLHPVLLAMAMEFKTDTGSSLKDQMNRLEAATVVNATAVTSAKEVAELARQAATHQMVLMETIRMELLRQGMAKLVALSPGDTAPIILSMLPAETAKV